MGKEYIKEKKFVRMIIVIVLFFILVGFSQYQKIVSVWRSYFNTVGSFDLKNPVSEQDDEMNSGLVVTWDCVWMGSYPQEEVSGNGILKMLLDSSEEWNTNDDLTFNGTKYHRVKDQDTYRYYKYEDVKWRILSVEGNTALVVSDQVLDYQQYNLVPAKVTWKSSTVRSFLNGYGIGSNGSHKSYRKTNFLSMAFSAAEQNSILYREVQNDDNETWEQVAGKILTIRYFYCQRRMRFRTTVIHL